MAESSFEKTEAPTPRRRQEAKESGNVARSTDLTAACILLASILLLYVFGFRIFTGMKRVVQHMLEMSPYPIQRTATILQGWHRWWAGLSSRPLRRLRWGLARWLY